MCPSLGNVVFLPSVCHSFNEIVMLLDSPRLQCYACKIDEGNFMDRNRHDMKTLFYSERKREPR